MNQYPEVQRLLWLEGHDLKNDGQYVLDKIQDTLTDAGLKPRPM